MFAPRKSNQLWPFPCKTFDDSVDAGFWVGKGLLKALLLLLPTFMGTQWVKLKSNFRYIALFYCMNRVRVKNGSRQGVRLGLCM